MDADTLACVVTKMNDKLTLCQWMLLRTQRSVSKTKVALRKYSLFILKLYPIFTSPCCTDTLSLLARMSTLKRWKAQSQKHAGMFCSLFSHFVHYLSFLRQTVLLLQLLFCYVSWSHCGIQWLKKTWSRSCFCAKSSEKAESEKDLSWSLFTHMLHVCRSVFTFLCASVETVLRKCCFSLSLQSWQYLVFVCQSPSLCMHAVPFSSLPFKLRQEPRNKSYREPICCCKWKF